MRTPESLMRIGLSLGLGFILTACAPSKLDAIPRVSSEKPGSLIPYPEDSFTEPDLSEAGVRATLESLRTSNPTCFVEDVEQELDDLIEGRDTFVLGIDGDPEAERKVEIIRAANKILLKRRAEELRERRLDKNDSAIRLASTYLDLAGMELNIASRYREESDSPTKLLSDCHSIKSISLNGSVILERQLFAIPYL